MDLSREELLDHYKHPRNCGLIEEPHFSGNDYNPSCGDRIAIAGLMSSDTSTMTALSFEGKGCVLSLATASMLTEHCTGKSVDEVLALSKDDILAMVGVRLGPTRLKCALLALEVLRDGIGQYKK